MSDTQNNFRMVTDDLAHCSRHQQTFCIGLGCAECKAHEFTRQREKEIMDELAAAALNAGVKIHYADDPVNHPKHYNDHPSGVECITITRHMGFNIGNAIKYLWRAGRKDKDFEIQDLRKAIWYIEDEIKRLERSK